MDSVVGYLLSVVSEQDWAGGRRGEREKRVIVFARDPVSDVE